MSVDSGGGRAAGSGFGAGRGVRGRRARAAVGTRLGGWRRGPRRRGAGAEEERRAAASAFAGRVSPDVSGSRQM